MTTGEQSSSQVKVMPDERTYKDLLDGGYLTQDLHGLRPRKVEELGLDLGLSIGGQEDHASVILKLRGIKLGPYRRVAITKGQLQQLLNLGGESLKAVKNGKVRIKHSAIYVVKPS